MPRSYKAHLRHAGHFERVARKANDLYERGGQLALDGLRLFDTEWTNIQRGQAWAAGHAAEDEDAARLCSAYPDAAVYCLSLRQDRRGHLRWLETGLASARRLQQRSVEAVLLGNLGGVCLEMGDGAS